MMARYRIVTDAYCGFEVQKKVWWWPFWYQLAGCNTHMSVESAEAFALSHVRKVAKDLGKLPA